MIGRWRRHDLGCQAVARCANRANRVRDAVNAAPVQRALAIKACRCTQEAIGDAQLLLRFLDDRPALSYDNKHSRETDRDSLPVLFDRGKASGVSVATACQAGACGHVQLPPMLTIVGDS